MARRRLNRPGARLRVPVRWDHIALIVICSVLTALGAHGYDEVLLVKAGFITKFPAFIGWPTSESGTASRNFKFCTLGRSDMNKPLQEVLDYTDMDGRTAVLEQVDEPTEIASCQVLYIPPRTKMPLSKILALAEGRPILTVSDSEGYGERGVMINLYVERGQVRFEINLETVSRSGLDLDFRLLELARLIGR